MTVTYEKSSLQLKDLVLGEAKSVATPLAPTPNSVDPQPVLELLAVSQVVKEREEPLVLFFASRRIIRPFLYFKKQDILLTTRTAFPWLQPDRLVLKGVCLVALLLKCGNSYRKGMEKVVEEVYPKTGYSKAMEQGSITLSKSVLKPTSIPELKTFPRVRKKVAGDVDMSVLYLVAY